jgi:EAL domain-containing protein (putative c-di-GMP-specific phosphodiesterase class I)
MDRELSGWTNPAMFLRDQLQHNGFALYCQPIIGILDTRPPMAESLVRMHEEEETMLPPGSFLPAFEHCQMLPQLDRWVVRSVLEQLKHGSRFPRFTVNVSSQTLLDGAFPEFVAEELRRTGVSEEALVFEVAEDDMLERIEVVTRFTRLMKALGTSIMIDSFARRSTTFAPLANLPIDFLKVDGSLVRKLIGSEQAQRKLRAIIEVARRVGYGVVAECVEDPEIIERLKFFGVDYAQGFAVGEPIPAS